MFSIHRKHPLENRKHIHLVQNKERKPGIEVAGEDGKIVRKEQDTHHNEEYPAQDGHSPQILAESGVVFEEGINPEGRKEERQTQPEGIYHQKPGPRARGL